MRIAVHQTDPAIGNVRRNLEGILAGIASTRSDLAVFPECALTGYGFDSLREARAFAEKVPGPSTEKILAACRGAGTSAVVGLLERAPGGGVYNSAAVIAPDGIRGTYRKMHQPFLGVDRFAAAGDRGFPVWDLPPARVGVLICYDLSIPEAARVLKLAGAQVLCVPTNWPEAAGISCDLAPFVRAQENHLHVATCNRSGEESGFRFPGRSRIIDCAGTALAEAGAGPAAISATVDPAASDANRIVIVPGKYELDRMAHRRPEFYGPVAEARDGVAIPR